MKIRKNGKRRKWEGEKGKVISGAIKVRVNECGHNLTLDHQVAFSGKKKGFSSDDIWILQPDDR